MLEFFTHTITVKFHSKQQSIISQQKQSSDLNKKHKVSDGNWGHMKALSIHPFIHPHILIWSWDVSEVMMATGFLCLGRFLPEDTFPAAAWRCWVVSKCLNWGMSQLTTKTIVKHHDIKWNAQLYLTVFCVLL